MHASFVTFQKVQLICFPQYCPRSCSKWPFWWKQQKNLLMKYIFFCLKKDLKITFKNAPMEWWKTKESQSPKIKSRQEPREVNRTRRPTFTLRAFVDPGDLEFQFSWPHGLWRQTTKPKACKTGCVIGNNPSPALHEGGTWKVCHDWNGELDTPPLCLLGLKKNGWFPNLAQKRGESICSVHFNHKHHVNSHVELQ